MGIDFETLIILAVLAFVLFGPEKLPEYAAKAGRLLAKLREASTELTQQAHASFPNLANPESMHAPEPANEPAPDRPWPPRPGSMNAPAPCARTWWVMISPSVPAAATA